MQIAAMARHLEVDLIFIYVIIAMTIIQVIIIQIILIKPMEKNVQWQELIIFMLKIMKYISLR